MMIKLKQIICTILLCYVVSFQYAVSREMHNPMDTVFVVFERPVMQNSFTEKSFRGMTILGGSLLSYINTDGFPTYIDEYPDTMPLALPTHNGYLEIGHQYKGLQINYFYLKGGDTVTFSYNEFGQPMATSRISEQLTQQYNFASQVNGASSHYGFSPKTTLLILTKNRLNYYNNEYKKYLENYKISLAQSIKKNILDSVYINYYKYRYAVELESYIFNGAILNNNKNQKNKFPLSDSLLNYISYLSILHRPSFESIELDLSIPPRSRSLAQYIVLRTLNLPSMIHKTSQELEPYYKRSDSVIVARVKSEFPQYYSSLIGVNKSELLLKDILGTTTTLSEVLSKYNGRVIYIDFWASWCAPCISGMAAGLELRKKYGNKVLFLYLAKGDKESSWRRAIEIHKIDQFGGLNYFVVDDNAEFIKKLGITAIPRYLIIDKSGEISNPNAPRPNSQEIHSELNKHCQSMP